MSLKSGGLTYFVLKEAGKNISPRIVLESATRDGLQLIRRQGCNAVYKQVDGGYECTHCRTPILLGLLDLGQDIEKQREEDKEYAPYCPNCEKDIILTKKPLIPTQNRFR
jgi:hypothetical protein